MMRCDSGRDVWGTTYTSDDAITIRTPRRCQRKATRWVAGDHGLRKECGYCLRGWITWLWGHYHYPDEPEEWLVKEYKTKDQVVENPGDHVCTWSKITKKEKEEYEKTRKGIDSK